MVALRGKTAAVAGSEHVKLNSMNMVVCPQD
jgi:hypothetical protein